MSFIRLEGIDTAFPLGSFEGTIIEENPNEARIVMRVEHSGPGGHGLGHVAAGRWRCTPAYTLGDGQILFPGQTPWPNSSVNIIRVAVGQWQFTFGSSPIFAAMVDANELGTIGSGATAFVTVTDFAPGSISSFVVHTQQGNSTTLADADLPFHLTIYPVQGDDPSRYSRITEAGDRRVTQAGDRRTS